MTNELLETVRTALREKVAPALGYDGAEIEVVEIFNGIASVKLGAICASCPATLPTVLAELEAELKKHAPQIEMLEAVM